MAPAFRSTGGAPFSTKLQLMSEVGHEPNTLLLLGEIRGQLRELIHTGNNNAQKLDQLAVRVGSLETERNRRDGANGLLSTVLRSPAIGWMVGGVTFLWGILTDRIHL